MAELDPTPTEQRHQLLAELADPVAVFGKLVREVEAGQVLVSLSVTGAETRAAALDALALARDVLGDAHQLLREAVGT